MLEIRLWPGHVFVHKRAEDNVVCFVYFRSFTKPDLVRDSTQVFTIPLRDILNVELYPRSDYTQIIREAGSAGADFQHFAGSFGQRSLDRRSNRQPEFRLPVLALERLVVINGGIKYLKTSIQISPAQFFL
jgi:hypothetical protein